MCSVVADGLTPALARERNLLSVCRAFEGAGISYFRVRNTSFQSTSVGVCAADRGAATRVLRALCAMNLGYVSATVPGARLQLIPGYASRSWKRLQDAPVVRVTRFMCDPSGGSLMGHEFGCDIEFWDRDGEGRLTAPRPNMVADSVPAAQRLVRVPATWPGTVAARSDEETSRTVATSPLFMVDLPEDILFPIDAVYTWVDDSDPLWSMHRSMSQTLPEMRACHELATADARFRNRNELMYSLRSLDQYAPWIRNVHVVTCGQRPDWLNAAHQRIHLVDHKEIFQDPGVLPTFNSHAIESQLHRIPGLANHFIYFNDDTFLGRFLRADMFFLSNGTAKFFPSSAKIPFPGVTSDSNADPVVTAGANNRELVRRAFGRTITRKMRHVPHALRIDVLEELEERFPEEYQRTASSAFRHPRDISVASSLHHYYAYHTNRAIPGIMKYAYADLGDGNLERRLNLLLGERNLDAFCLNDTGDTGRSPQEREDLVQGFLEAYFPVPSPFEERLAPSGRGVPPKQLAAGSLVYQRPEPSGGTAR
ncbi:stealth conserved region 3 domain-containing protein [Streptomyces sp. BA2]|uniref:stealth conserved region 3 domain-containing protein n=1 Tax=Streptomyces sp. BA2 TaxID=436595 RepID=UPI001371C1DA